MKMNPAWIVFVFINSHKIQFKILRFFVCLFREESHPALLAVELRLQAPPQGLSVGKGVFSGGECGSHPQPCLLPRDPGILL